MWKGKNILMISTPPIDLRGMKIAGFEVTNPKAARKKGRLVGLFGSAKVGKTLAACKLQDAPSTSPMLYLDCEGGTDVFADREDIALIPVYTLEGMRKIGQALALDCKAKSIVIDNGSEIVRRCHTYWAQHPKYANNNDNRAPWADVTNEFEGMIRGWRDLAWQHEVTVVVIMWDIWDKNETTGTERWSYCVNPALQNYLPGYFDISIHMTADGSGIRKWQLEQNGTTQAGIRRPADAASQTIPNMLYDSRKSSRMFIDLMACLNDGVPFPTELYMRNSK